MCVNSGGKKEDKRKIKGEKCVWIVDSGVWIVDSGVWCV